MSITMKRIIIPALVAAAALGAPSFAQADILDELDAADAVEERLDVRYKSYDWLASCRQTRRRTFSCSITGIKQRPFRSADGRAFVTKRGYGYRVKIVKLNFN